MVLQRVEQEQPWKAPNNVPVWRAYVLAELGMAVGLFSSLGGTGDSAAASYKSH